TDKLPPNLLALFQPRPPVRYLAPVDIAPEKRITPRLSGVAKYAAMLNDHVADYTPTESIAERQERLKAEKKAKHEQDLKEALEKWDPSSDSQARGDPYRTLFVSRVHYEATEEDVDREFSKFGPIERIRIVKNTETGKPTGYAFIVYEREKDMKTAYKECDGLRIRDRRVVVDVERGRTVKGWKPRRLGGGLGG
ncbi:RNA-binding domain-containing protein, partial [Saitoella complicata NRRL Y-17804]